MQNLLEQQNLFHQLETKVIELQQFKPKRSVALNLFTQKDLIEAVEKAERRIKREKNKKKKLNKGK